MSMDHQESHLPPPAEADLLHLEDRLGAALPASYRSFLGSSNGLESEGVYLYGAQSLLRENETFNIRECSPDHLNIGHNGGGEAYVVSLREPAPVYVVGHGSMHPDDMKPVADSFAGWAAAGFPLPVEDDEPGWARSVDVYLERPPAGGMKDVYAIRKSLALDIGISDLVQQASKTPVALLRDVPYGRYWERVRQLNLQCGGCLAIREIERR